MDAARIAQAERLLGHTFSDSRLLRTALTHPSYAAEHADADTYDRLEFLGDAVLGFVISAHVYAEFPGAHEGELTTRKHHVVAGDSLAEAADALGLSEFVLVGAGARASGDRKRASVLENAVEALIGALYLDGGLDAAREFILRVLGSRLTDRHPPVIDAKGALQQYTQAHSQSLPAYRIIATSGPVHDRTFTVEVAIDGEVLGTGSGASKQAAEKAAAGAALASLRDGGVVPEAPSVDGPSDAS